MKNSKVSSFDAEKKSFGKAAGLGWFTTALFLVADMAGGGIVALPIAMLQSGGVTGVIIITTLAVMFCYTSHILGENWTTMCERWTDYEEHCRKPYPEMAYRAMGKKAKTICSSILNVMLFGVSVVYLLLSSKIINDFVTSVSGHNIGFCLMIIILAVALWPITLLKSPQDFWWAVIVAMLTTLFSAVLIMIGTVMDFPYCRPYQYTPPFDLSTMVLSLGTFMFGYGGHAVFPTVQHDMKNPRHFTRSSIVAFIMVTAMYGPISVLGYITYGNSLESSVINSIQINWIQRAANVFIAVHCILTLTVVINPLNQEVEQLFNTSQKFGWSRVLIRTVIMIAVVFTAESIPDFGPILNVIGGTAVALTSAILPALYNLYLHAAVLDDSNKKYKRPNFIQVVRRTPKFKLCINICVIVIAIVCGVATTQTAVYNMLSTKFTKPCYLSYFENTTSFEGPTRCCGISTNISRYGSPSEFCTTKTI